MKCVCNCFILNIIFVGFACLYSCAGSNKPYILYDFNRYSGIDSGYKINKSIFQANQYLLYVTITTNEKEKIKKRFTFLTHYSFQKIYLAPRIQFELYDLDKANENYMYYISDGTAPHEYFVICLAKEKNQIIYCESFRETSPGIF